VAKVYDYESIVTAFLYAQHQWLKHGRVERKTYMRIRKLMSQRVVDKMTAQLLAYHNPMSTMKPVGDLFELPEWRKAWNWARKGDEPRCKAALAEFSHRVSQHDANKVQQMLEAQQRQVGL